MDRTSKLSDEQRAEIKAIVKESIKEYFTETGRLTKNILLTAATVIGAVVVIGGGLKYVLALFGFRYVAGQ